MTILDESILCVDDEPSNLALLRRMLQGEHRVTFARSGIEALELAAKTCPSLILLDIGMPGLSGLEVCKRLKAEPRTAEIPVIFVSGMDDGESAREGFDAGAVDFIGKPLSTPIVRTRVRAQLALARATMLEKSLEAAVSLLGEIGHFNDAGSAHHARRMGAYCGALAEGVGWTPGRAKQLALAATLHDLGQLATPRALLEKPGALDATDRRILSEHPALGHRLLSAADAPLFALAAEIALHHHERWDGSGYPARLSGEQIPESARIVAVADTFDALTRKRPHRGGVDVDRALALIDQAAGKELDPRLVEALRAAMPKVLEIKGKFDAKP
jgi:putative two-component system response regulator